jgi:hypothetical protein
MHVIEAANETDWMRQTWPNLQSRYRFRNATP